MEIRNAEIFKRWKLLQHKIELGLSSVLFYQAFIQQPQMHAQLLMPMFHNFRLEGTKQMDTEGGINTVIAHPSLLQWNEDLLFVFVTICECRYFG